MTGRVLLAVTGVVLLVLAATTARRPGQPVPDRDGYFARWQVLHGGYDPQTGDPWLRGWLTMAYMVARPLARRGVQPDVLTLSSAWLAGAVVVAAGAGGRWSLLAGGLLVASGLSDNLDGCVAVLQERTSAWGYVLDSVVDRVSDSAYLVAAVLAGAPVGLAASCGFGCFLLEYLRARAGNAGGDDVGRVTVGERPSRVIFLSVSLLAAGILVRHHAVIATAGVWTLTGVTAVALVQLVLAVRRQLQTVPSDRSGIVPGP